MKTLIAFYSFSGNTKKFCEKLVTNDCDLLEIKELTQRSVLGAYFKGSIQAMRQKPSVIGSIGADMSQYENVVFACPVWAGNLAPAGVAFLQKTELDGKSVTVIALSKSGQDCSEKIKALFSNSKAKLNKVYCLKEGQTPETSIF